MPEAVPSGKPRICFVVMPFGRKVDLNTGETIDFDQVYEFGIAPAIKAAALEPVRADTEVYGDVIYKPMFSRLLTSDCCVFDLTTANANVLYELGIRHTARASTTIAICSDTHRFPFDSALMRPISYELAGGRLSSSGADRLKAAVTSR
ncbi:MAG TPA: DUF4071 domain-containing protein, partial [Candidatus Angelobacter sp.]|nr:DUF4071 domain-containing protein [Candidatus Angelobacter sp.]